MPTRSSRPLRLLFVIGTRPEAIKLAPVILRARENPEFEVRVCATGQHRDLLDPVLSVFGITPDVDLNVMTVDQQPAAVASQLIAAVNEVMERERPHWAIVQGDTVSTFASSVAAFYGRVAVAHVEAGLRTHDLCAPWPEEMNRRLTSAVTTLHFAPTATARAHLLREGVSSDAIEVTGNTGIDAVREITGRLAAMEQRPTVSMGLDETKRIVLVTAHRRENIGARLAAICEALRPIADAVPDALIVLVGHRNPNARATIENFVKDGGPHARIRVFEPLDYATFIDLLQRCSVVITDSGGVQEEAPLFGKPLLVLRDVTERPEVLEAGVARLVGADRDTITRECVRLLTDPDYYGTMSRVASPFGDGHAAERIVRRLLRED